MNDHGRSKYKREVHCLESPYRCIIDVYSVLEAFVVTCPARQHLIKKILCTGIRGKGDSLQDLEEAKVALDRAIVLEKERLKKNGQGNNETKEAAEITTNPGVDVTTEEVVRGSATPNDTWRAIMVTDERGVNPIGFRVGWLLENGRTFLVAHYLAGEGNTTGPSLNWCKNAAEEHAKRLNNENKRPEDFLAYRSLMKQTEQETKKDV